MNLVLNVYQAFIAQEYFMATFLDIRSAYDKRSSTNTAGYSSENRHSITLQLILTSIFLNRAILVQSVCGTLKLIVLVGLP